MNERKEYENFLSTIDLKKYREQYSKIKSVEEDLPKNIQILKLIYKTYWEDKKFTDYDSFWDVYFKLYEKLLIDYNIKRNGNSIHSDGAYLAFLDGLKARLYRTWASILGQIQLGYVIKSIYTDREVLMSAELDWGGVDIRVVGYEDYDVKKITKRKDIKTERINNDETIKIRYYVPSRDVIENPYLKNGEYCKPYLDFKKDNTLDILPNGFVIFTENVILKNE